MTTSRTKTTRRFRLVLHVMDSTDRAQENLQETAVRTIFGQVGDIRMPQRMRRQIPRQTKRVTVGDEPCVDLRRLDPPAPRGEPQRRLIPDTETGRGVVHVVG